MYVIHANVYVLTFYYISTLILTFLFFRMESHVLDFLQECHLHGRHPQLVTMAPRGLLVDLRPNLFRLTILVADMSSQVRCQNPQNRLQSGWHTVSSNFEFSFNLFTKTRISICKKWAFFLEI